MKQSEITKKDSKELKELITEKREALRSFRFDIAGSQIRETRLGRAHRKDIARALTELRVRDLKHDTQDS